ncbi:hypothetical protein [Methanocaldococcus sp.]|uniref:hypothetical protein n=1 Tax=Methanocaldococcus sp. TaxID=2152917 RepID=UPI002606E9B5|nr:hypothetical protein [Methanocaldococcus sp.]MCQ6253803.1 hypothetical protein [Methanocaldococcus sp.]
MNVKFQYMQIKEDDYDELKNLKRDLTRAYTGSEVSKVLGYILAGLIIVSAVAPILF